MINIRIDINKIIVIIVLFFCSVNVIFSQNYITGRVIKVADGDTFTILTIDKKQVRIRLYGIDAPEKGQDYGTKSRLFVNELIYNKHVIIQSKGIDRYNRMLGIVWVDDINLNEELLKNGLAWHYKHFDKSKRYSDLEAKARKEKLNIWSLNNPIEPYEFRKAKKRNNKQ